MSTVQPDLSQRFVLPADSPLLANLAALWAILPELARQIESLLETPSYPTERARSGEVTLAVPTSTGRPLYLHSRFQPGDEAKKLIGGLDTDENVAFFVQGFGLGYHLLQLLERSSDESLLFSDST